MKYIAIELATETYINIIITSPLAKTAKYQGSFRINGARTFNTLPLAPRLISKIRLAWLVAISSADTYLTFNFVFSVFIYLFFFQDSF